MRLVGLEADEMFFVQAWMQPATLLFTSPIHGSMKQMIRVHGRSSAAIIHPENSQLLSRITRTASVLAAVSGLPPVTSCK